MKEINSEALLNIFEGRCAEVERLSMDESGAYCELEMRAVDDREECRKELLARLNAPAWRPIATAPMDGTRILLRIRNGDLGLGGWNGGFWATTHGVVCADSATHWAPLPADPSTNP